MKKLVYILLGAGLFTAGCNEPAKFDQAACEHRADSMATARVMTDSETLYAEQEETCGRQLSVLETTRDSLVSILATTGTGTKKSGTKKSTGTTTGGSSTTTDPDKTRGGGVKAGGDEKTRGSGTKEGDVKDQKTRGGATKQ